MKRHAMRRIAPAIILGAVLLGPLSPAEASVCLLCDVMANVWKQQGSVQYRSHGTDYDETWQVAGGWVCAASHSELAGGWIGSDPEDESHDDCELPE